MTDPDQDILDRFRHSSEGRELAFSMLVQRYKEKIYYHVRRVLLSHSDTDDVVQEVFIKIWKGLGNFRGESKLSSWIYRISFNEAINFLHAKKRLAGVPLDAVEKLIPSVLQSDEHYSGDEIDRKLQAAVAALPEKQKQVFILKYFEDLMYSEIAEITGTSEGALKASYHHAVQKIQESVKAALNP